VFPVLSCQIGCADKCITDEDGLVVVAVVVLVAVVLVMSSPVVVVVPPVVDVLFPPPSCARAVVIVIGVMGLRITKPPGSNSVSVIIMMDTVAEVLPPLPSFLEKDAFLSLPPLFFLIIDIVVLATAQITI
jgi:hypothetical protein